MPGEIWVTGPFLDLTLRGTGSSALSVEVLGVVDTGASVICLDQRIAKQLGLTAVNRRQMEVADGTQIEATTYMAEMDIPQLEFCELVEVFGVPMTYRSNRVLLGRSFLKNYIVTYNGPNDLFHYHRPVPSLPEEFDE